MEPTFRTNAARTSDPSVVTRPDAARVLLDPDACALLAPFVGREVTLSEAARDAGVPLNTLKYRLRQFERLGLVERTRQLKRRGRPVQAYRAAASMFVPFSVTPLQGAAYLYDVLFAGMHGPLLHSVGAAWDAAAGERELGVHIYRGQHGRVTKDIVPQPRPDDVGSFFEDLLLDDRPAVWNTGNVVHLTRAEAKAFQRDLVDLVGRYTRGQQDQEGSSARAPYIYRLAIAPYVAPLEP